MKRFLDWYYSLYAKSAFKLCLAIIWALLMVFSAFQIQKIKVAFDFESFFAQDSPDKTFYTKHKQIFGYDNDYLLLILQPEEKQIFSPTFFQALDKWQKVANKVNGVESINSPLTLKRLINSPFGLTPYPLIHYQDKAQLQVDSARIVSHPLYNQFFNLDENAVLVFIKHRHFSSQPEEEIFLEELQNGLQQSSLHVKALVGRLTAQKSFVENIQDDFLTFSFLALILSALILWMIYKSLKLMLIPYLLSVSAMLITLGSISLSGIPLSVLSVLLPTIILFVSTSDAIHLLNAFQNSNKHPALTSYIERLKWAVQEVLGPTFLTSATTAIGFLTLILLPSNPIKELGFMAAVGVLIAFVINFIFSPLLLSAKIRSTKQLISFRKFTYFLLRNRNYILIVFTLLTVGSVLLSSQLTTDSYLLKDLPENDEVRNEFEFVDEHFGGSKPWELAIWPSDSSQSLWELDRIRAIHYIASYLEDSLAFNRILSPDQLVKYANQANHGGLKESYIIPEQNEEQVLNSAKKINSYTKTQLITDNGKYARILAFMPDWGANLTQLKNDKLQKFMERNSYDSLINFRITGTSFLIDKSNESVSKNLVWGLFIAVLLIAVVLALYFRSLKIVIISLIPNLIPLVITAGIMALMNVPLKLTTTIIFVVSFSIAVDDTIHFIAAYKLKQNKSHFWKVLSTFNSAGKAIIITTLVIVSGFSLFIFSDFATTFYLGCYLSISLLSALLTDVYLLPILLNKSN